MVQMMTTKGIYLMHPMGGKQHLRLSLWNSRLEEVVGEEAGAGVQGAGVGVEADALGAIFRKFWKHRVLCQHCTRWKPTTMLK